MDRVFTLFITVNCGFRAKEEEEVEKNSRQFGRECVLVYDEPNIHS